jgi:hypothetical protein
VGSPENHLFQAALARAFEDAVAPHASSATKHNAGTQQDEQARARVWLLKGGVDVRMVCSLADIEFDTVQKAARTLASGGWRWRRVGVPVSQKDARAMLLALHGQSPDEDSHMIAMILCANERPRRP